MKTLNVTPFVAVILCWFLIGCDSQSSKSASSPYYSSNALAQTLKPGMTKEEVVSVFGEPDIEFNTGPNGKYYCLTYRKEPDMRIRQKRGEYTGFQVVLSSNKMVKWDLILSSTDPR